MIFSSLEYLLFLPVVVLLYWRLTSVWRLVLVVVSSFFFCMSWLPGYGLLLLGLTSVNWLLAVAIAASTLRSPAFARLLLGLGLFINLGCLCYYKYAGFVLENLAQALQIFRKGLSPFAVTVPAWDVPVMSVLLPLGISFFIFEFVHYLVDVFKGGKPLSSWLEFAAFASFFPSQIAGPIKRYQDFSERLRRPDPLTWNQFFEAMGLIVQGLFKKIAIADPIGNVIYPAFAAQGTVSSGDALIASLGFVVQVYCDFSGYTDIGRGSALLLGVRLPENFQLPYLAANLADFWRRWHISLSSWLRDYIFIPLGGSRHGLWLTWRNLLVTMLVCGLWHGASWHYVVFGCMQGLGLIIHKEWQAWSEKFDRLSRFNASKVAPVWGCCVTMAFITLSFVVFRAPDMGHAWLVLQGYFNVQGDCELIVPLVKSGACVFGIAYFSLWLAQLWVCRQKWSTATLEALQLPLRLAACTVAVILMLAAKPAEAVPFVYFQF